MHFKHEKNNPQSLTNATMPGLIERQPVAASSLLYAGCNEHAGAESFVPPVVVMYFAVKQSGALA